MTEPKKSNIRRSRKSDEARGAAVQHAAQAGPVGFAVRSEAQDAPEGIARHIRPPYCGP